MRKLHITGFFFLLIMAGGLLFAWDGYSYVSATGHDTFIRIDWKAKNERGVKKYKIYRSRSEDDVLSGTSVAKIIDPLGNGFSYTYDDEIFGKASASGGFSFYYVVCAVLTNDEEKYSDVKQAFLSTGVRQQTWGSIKAMFR